MEKGLKDDSDTDPEHMGFKKRFVAVIGRRRTLKLAEEGNTPSAEPSQTPAASQSGPNAIRAEPRVLHGYTLTKEVPFRDVCIAIRDTAFVARYVGLVPPF